MLGAHSEGVVVDEAVSVKFVAARLGDDVDDAAERPAVLRLVAAGLDFDFLDELTVDRLSLEAANDVGRVDSVDDELVLDRCRSVDRQRQSPSLSVALILVDARIRSNDLRVIATQWKLLHDLGGVARSPRRRRRVDERCLAADDHGFLGGKLELEIQCRRAVNGDGSVSLDAAQPLESRRDLVDARREAGQPVTPVVRGQGGARPLKVGTRRLDCDAGQRLSFRVGDGAYDRARRLSEDD